MDRLKASNHGRDFAPVSQPSHHYTKSIMSTKHPGTSSTPTLQQRFAQAEPRAGITLLVFWKNLFELNPVLRPLLPESTAEQDRLLTRLLNAEVGALAGIRPPASRFSETDLKDGTAPCSVAGEALLWTLQEAYGADFTPQARAAWEVLYRFVTGTTKTVPAKSATRPPEPALAVV
jgi:hypothetical protein